MRTRKITNEQLSLLDKLVKEGKSNDDIYKVLGVKFYAIAHWKKKIKNFGLDKLIATDENSREFRRNEIVTVMRNMGYGEEIFIDDNDEFSAGSLVSSLYREHKKFSKVRQKNGWLLTRVE